MGNLSGPCGPIFQTASGGALERSRRMSPAGFQVRSTEFTRGIDPRDRIECEGESFNIVGG